MTYTQLIQLFFSEQIEIYGEIYTSDFEALPYAARKSAIELWIDGYVARKDSDNVNIQAIRADAFTNWKPLIPPNEAPTPTVVYNRSNIPMVLPPSVATIVAGANISVNNADPKNPVVSASAPAHTHTPSEVTGTAIIEGDSRLSDARTPIVHTHPYEPANANIQAHVLSAHAPAGATVNSPDATLLARANHTGTQAQSTIVNLTTD